MKAPMTTEHPPLLSTLLDCFCFDFFFIHVFWFNTMFAVFIIHKIFKHDYYYYMHQWKWNKKKIVHCLHLFMLFFFKEKSNTKEEEKKKQSMKT